MVDLYSSKIHHHKIRQANLDKWVVAQDNCTNPNPFNLNYSCVVNHTKLGDSRNDTVLTMFHIDKYRRMIYNLKGCFQIINEKC